MKKNQSNPGEPLIAHREHEILNTDFHMLYLLFLLLLLKQNKENEYLIQCVSWEYTHTEQKLLWIQRVNLCASNFISLFDCPGKGVLRALNPFESVSHRQDSFSTEELFSELPCS